MKPLTLAKGFSLLELTVVLVIVGLLMVFYITAVDSPVEDSHTKSIEFQASTFSRTVINLHGLAISKKLPVVQYQQTHIYVNEFGWPVNTSSEHSPLSNNQTAEECLQLWKGIFHNPPLASIGNKGGGKSNKSESKYLINSIDGHICRFQLARIQAGIYFFDYDVKTGTVIVSTQ